MFWASGETGMYSTAPSQAKGEDLTPGNFDATLGLETGTLADAVAKVPGLTAQGVVDAYKSIGNINVPVIVRLQGTNASEAKELIDHSGLKVFSAITLQEAANLVKETI